MLECDLLYFDEKSGSSNVSESHEIDVDHIRFSQVRAPLWPFSRANAIEMRLDLCLQQALLMLRKVQR